MENWYKGVLIAVLALATVVGIIAGRSQPAPAATLPAAAPAATAALPAAGQVLITGAGFQPRTLTVHTGQKVTWINEDTQAHGPVANNSSFASSGMSQGQTFSWTPTNAGTYAYADFENPNFAGTIVVKP